MEDGTQAGQPLTMLFGAGLRPSAQNIAAFLQSAPASGLAASISHRPADAEGWLELLLSGLTFDLRGLTPAAPQPPVPSVQRLGIHPDESLAGLEAIDLVPAGHIASGAGLQPVVRAMMGLAANLVLHFPARAVAWQPAGTLMAPDYFSRIVLNWLSGGPFPALGLAALMPDPQGRVSSQGLGYFTGQELQVEPRSTEEPADTVKLAARMADYLVRHGPLDAALELETAGEMILAEPSQVGRQVWIWRK